GQRALDSVPRGPSGTGRNSRSVSRAALARLGGERHGRPRRRGEEHMSVGAGGQVRVRRASVWGTLLVGAAALLPFIDCSAPRDTPGVSALPEGASCSAEARPDSQSFVYGNADDPRAATMTVQTVVRGDGDTTIVEAIEQGGRRLLTIEHGK